MRRRIGYVIQEGGLFPHLSVRDNLALLPRWLGCHRLRPGELFLLNPAPDSLDGRYFGPLPDTGVVGVAHPLLVRDAPGAPLRWRRDADRSAFTPEGKDMSS